MILVKRKNWLRHLINFIYHLGYNHWTVDSDIVSAIFLVFYYLLFLRTHLPKQHPRQKHHEEYHQHH